MPPNPSSPFPSRSQVSLQAGGSSAAPGRSKPSFFNRLLGVVGELLITIAIILGLYVVWQLYWTTLEVTPGMEQRITDFQDANPGLNKTTTDEKTDDPPAETSPIGGDVFGVLHVPLWNWMQIPIAEGTTSAVLDTGNAGHYVDTQMPGEIGNFAIAGHRRTYGNNFRRVDILQPGDQLVVETAEAYLVYEVIGHEIVDPSQGEVVYPVPHERDAIPTQRLMTMTTCHPEYGNSERYIVYSEMKYWTAKDEGKPEILKDEPVR